MMPIAVGGDFLYLFLIIYKIHKMYIIRNIMNNQFLTQQLELGAKITAQRKALGVRAQSTARSAGISRVTLHRIEKGETSVSLGAYLQVCKALGLHLEIFSDEGKDEVASEQSQQHFTVDGPHIRISDYPQLTTLAWQLDPSALLTDGEVRSIYERNKCFLQLEKLHEHERALIQRLIVERGMENIFV